MNLDEYKALVGKVVRLLPGVEDSETGFEPGMMGVVCQVDLEDDDVVLVTVDFSKFEEYNKGFMTPNYYDEHQQPKFKWCETRYYPVSKREDLYLTLGDPPKGSPNYFQVVGDAADKVVLVSKEKLQELLELADSVSPANEMAMDNNAMMLAKAVRVLLK